jgi:Flp pilus assembly protein TadD
MSSELVEVAILAYRNARYRDAIELLLQVTDAEGDNWLARLYLGMSYHRNGRVADAARLFKRMVTDCPDQHIRSKAEHALPLVEAEMRRRFQTETATQKTSSDESDEIVWVAGEKYYEKY